MDEISSLSDAELCAKLKECGFKGGAITKATRKLFEKRLRKHFTKNEPAENPTPPEDQNISFKEVKSPLSHSVSPQSSKEESENDIDVVYYAVCTPKDKETTHKDLVFTSLKDASSAMKGLRQARLRKFSCKEAAVNFTKCDNLEFSKLNGDVKPGESKIEYKSPKPQELVVFRNAVECGKLEQVQSFIDENPTYLVSTIEVPVILQEGCRYNALHVAAKANQLEMFKLILQNVQDPELWKKLFPNETSLEALDAKCERMVDYYLNTSDKGAGDTPLHMACRFGYADIVRYIVSLPCVDRYKKNRFEEAPDQVICSRCSGNESQKKKEIEDLLSTKFYITLLRTEDDTRDPIICAPVSSSMEAVKKHNLNSSSSPLDSTMKVGAFAGPMTKNKANVFFEEWKCKEWKSPNRSIFAKDFEKGKERVGRDLSKKHGVAWTEYWPFLQSFANLSSPAGLQKLENYFKNCIQLKRHTVPKRIPVSESSLRKRSLLNRSLESTTDHDLFARSLLDDFNQEVGNKESLLSDSMEVELQEPRVPISEKAEISLNVNELTDSISNLSMSDRDSTDIKDSSTIMTYNANRGEFCQSLDSLSPPLILTDSPDQHSIIPNIEVSSKKPEIGSSFMEESEICKNFFIAGPYPSKLDFDVFQALDGVEYNHKDFPYLHKWMENVRTYPDDKQLSWPSPCSPRYRSRLASGNQ
ncbi:ankyrin repeat and LEM domain-containing protein 2-like isoform X1 [Rhopilema esculentum]|uniref:ankyrin repeat and LEM domain-containing protein 2-like isoform X1 n=2 Tax=Rhopilema esculentum TaxID=499914 RepID=UPI0031E35C15